jgi:hypothetical protein
MPTCTWRAPKLLDASTGALISGSQIKQIGTDRNRTNPFFNMEKYNE